MAMKRLSEYNAERDGADFCPVVSVYVATYNHERFVADCLEGILLQECDFGVEVIVIDDASTDGTASIVAEYAERYPHLFKAVLLEDNYYRRGLPLFHDVFLPRARGEFVAFCEGDDYWTYEGKLQRQVDFLRRHRFYSACFHGFEVRNDLHVDKGISFDRLERSRRCGVRDMIINYMAQTATVVGRLDVLRADAEFMAERFPLDLRIYLAWLHSGRVYGMAECWSVYRIHEDGISVSLIIDGSTEARNAEWRRRLDECYGREYNLERMYRADIENRRMLESWTLARRSGRWCRAMGHLFRAFVQHPRVWVRRYWYRYFHHSWLRY